MAAAVAMYMLLPLALVLQQAWGEPRPGGFGRGGAELLRLSGASLVYALLPALAAALLCTACSLLACFNKRWEAAYSGWLFLLLFTNPVFLVFGFAVILVRWPSNLAVLVATAYILVPLCGLIIRAAVNKYPVSEIQAARALGARPSYIAIRHILPRVASSVRAGVVLATLYAVGFYIVPALVGIGRVTTLGTAIDKAANSIGDRRAACQLCVVALGLQAVLLLLWRLSAGLGRRTEGVA